MINPCANCLHCKVKVYERWIKETTLKYYRYAVCDVGVIKPKTLSSARDMHKKDCPYYESMGELGDGYMTGLQESVRKEINTEGLDWYYKGYRTKPLAPRWKNGRYVA